MSEEPDFDEFIFDWFHDRYPDEMQDCLAAHRAACRKARESRPS